MKEFLIGLALPGRGVLRFLKMKNDFIEEN
jgi:hypothetical protein